MLHQCHVVKENLAYLFEAEVMIQLRKLANVKCEDLDDLLIELLKWGGDVIGSIVI